MSQLNHSHAWYALRRSLPLFKFDELLQELVDYLPHYAVDEIIVIIDAEEFFHGQPHLNLYRTYQDKLFQIKDEMHKIGVQYSLNPWVTQGHADRGRDARTHLSGIQTIVKPDGVELTARACPLSDVWRENIRDAWTLLAQTHPKVLWVEDDIRAFGENSCFCPLHLAMFSERIGRGISRDQLVNAILKPGKPHPWRQEFLKMESQIMSDTAEYLAKTVHDVSPETQMGLMSSGPRNHCMEGRNWTAFSKALTDGVPPMYSRPTMGNYWEDSMRGLYHSQDSIKITRLCCPEGTIEHTELENIPFTQYSKTATFSFLQMAISYAFGSHGVAINIFDHLGTPMQDEPQYGKMLGDKKSYFDALAAIAQKPGKYQGVRLLHDDRYGYHCKVRQGEDLSALTEDGFSTMQMLESMGIPTIYEDSSVTVAVGQQLRTFSDEEIIEMLSGGVLLDAVSAEVLQSRGFSEYIGLKKIHTAKPLENHGPLSAEEFFNNKFGGKSQNYMTTLVPAIDYKASLALIEVAAGTDIVSRIVDHDANYVCDCMSVFENTFGGRVAVHAWDYETALGVSFNSNTRQRQMQNLMRWLSRDRMPLIVYGQGAYPLVLRKDLEHETFLGFFNLTLDPWPEVIFELYHPRQFTKVIKLSKGGDWVEAEVEIEFRDSHKLVLKYNDSICLDEPMFLRIL